MTLWNLYPLVTVSLLWLRIPQQSKMQFYLVRNSSIVKETFDILDMEHKSQRLTKDYSYFVKLRHGWRIRSKAEHVEGTCTQREQGRRGRWASSAAGPVLLWADTLTVSSWGNLAFRRETAIWGGFIHKPSESGTGTWWSLITMAAPTARMVQNFLWPWCSGKFQ